MVADRLPDEAQFTLFLDGFDQAEVAGAATDIDHQAAHPWLDGSISAGSAVASHA